MYLKESAESIFRILQSDPVFEHAGADSRSIVFPTKSFVHDLSNLADNTSDPFAYPFLKFASGIANHY